MTQDIHPQIKKEIDPQISQMSPQATRRFRRRGGRRRRITRSRGAAEREPQMTQDIHPQISKMTQILEKERSETVVYGHPDRTPSSRNPIDRARTDCRWWPSDNLL